MPHVLHQIRVRDRRSGATSDHRFTTATVRIGREADSDLQLADPFVSVQHAVLESDEHGARLRDLGGVNGLRVAGKRLAPHTVVPVGERLGVSVGPYDLDILHRPARDRRAASGALSEPGPAALTQVHAHLRALHRLHAPLVAARRAFEAALADAVHDLHAAGDARAVGRVLAEFPAADHAHLLLTARPRAPRAAAPPVGHLSHETSTPPGRPAHDLLPRGLRRDDLPASTSPIVPPLGHDLSPRTSSISPLPEHDLSPRPSPAPLLDNDLSPGPALAASLSGREVLTLLSTAACALLPDQRPPASLDEARRFLARLTATLRTFAAGVGALQHLRLRQARDLGVAPLDGANPLLGLTGADELLAALLSWREPHGERTPELLDCFAVLTGHARAHVAATLAAARHLAAELAPPTIDHHAPRGLLRCRARWHSFVARYTACLGEDAATGTLRTSFRAAYLDELDRHGLAVAPLST